MKVSRKSAAEPGHVLYVKKKSAPDCRTVSGHMLKGAWLPDLK